MTTQQAKELLNKTGVTLDDEEIEKIIICFNQIIEIGFELYEAQQVEKE